MFETVNRDMAALIDLIGWFFSSALATSLLKPWLPHRVNSPKRSGHVWNRGSDPWEPPLRPWVDLKIRCPNDQIFWNKELHFFDWYRLMCFCSMMLYYDLHQYIDTCYSSSIHILYYISYISSSIYCSLAFASTLSWSRGSHRSWSQGQRARSSMVRKCQESFGHQVAGDVRSVEDLLIHSQDR